MNESTETQVVSGTTKRGKPHSPFLSLLEGLRVQQVPLFSFVSLGKSRTFSKASVFSNDDDVMATTRTIAVILHRITVGIK